MRQGFFSFFTLELVWRLVACVFAQVCWHMGLPIHGVPTWLCLLPYIWWWDGLWEEVFTKVTGTECIDIQLNTLCVFVSQMVFYRCLVTIYMLCCTAQMVVRHKDCSVGNFFVSLCYLQINYAYVCVCCCCQLSHQSIGYTLQCCLVDFVSVS